VADQVGFHLTLGSVDSVDDAVRGRHAHRTPPQPPLRRGHWRGEKADGQDADPDKAAGFRAHGKSKDSRDDLPQIVIGLAVTRDGIPVRCWCWPGNTADSALIRQVRSDMREWSLGRIIWVADRGFSSARYRRFLQQGAGGYIIGEKLRSESPHVKEALSRQGRYQQAAGNLQVKEVRIADASDRFIICYNQTPPNAMPRPGRTSSPDSRRRSPGRTSCPRPNEPSCAGRSP
jgi:hypothetical protein